MLYPQTNTYRQRLDLSGYWSARFDPGGQGAEAGWSAGFDGARPIAVPGSWNEQFEEHRDYLGQVWYSTRFGLPWGWEQQRVFVRFASVFYLAEVWLNGSRLGQHEGGSLPFEFDLTPHILRRDNLLVVRVEAELDERRVPPGAVPDHPEDTYPNRYYPDVNYPFFPYAGIQQPVLLYTKPHGAVEDLTVVTELREGNGTVKVTVSRAVSDTTTLRVTLSGFGEEIRNEIETSSESATVTLAVPHPALWSPNAPNLYDLTVELATGLGTYDQYTLPVGIRTVKVEDGKLLLNGEPLAIRGFGRHEDLPIAGRGVVPPAVIKDLSLMRWMGANCLRTQGYPASEEMLGLCDRLGILVIAETPVAGLVYAGTGLEKRYNLSREMAKRTVLRDKNHPSIIMWSLAGEPHSKRGASGMFLDRAYRDAKAVDNTRPYTVVSMVGLEEQAFKYLDVVCVNLHPGWDFEHGRIKDAMTEFSARLDAIHDKYPKPMIVSEFAGEAIPGQHALPSEMWAEEYQAELVAGAIQVIRTKPYIIGHLVGPLSDFKTAQSVTSPGGISFRGMFTRDRRPKLAAHSLRTLWRR